MKNLNGIVNKIFNTVIRTGRTNLPNILTGSGIILGGVTLGYVYKKSPEAHQKREEAIARAKKNGKGTVGTKVEGFKATSSVMWPAYLMAAASAGCFIGSNKVSNDRLAATVATCGFLKKKLDAIQETEKEVLGNNKAEDLKRKTYEHMMEKSEADPDKPEEPKKPYVGLPQLYYDVLNDRFLHSTDDILREAENKVNIKVYAEYQDGSFEDDIGPNDFYEIVGWAPTKGSKGWCFDSKACFSHGEEGIEMIIGKTCVVAPNGEAAKVVDFHNLAPRWNKRT